MNVLRIAWTDVKWVGKDWQAVLWMLVMPLVLAFLLGSMFRSDLLSKNTWIPVGDSPLFLLPVILCLATLAGCLGMLCGVLCQTERQVTNVAIFAAMVLAALGGCWWPIEIVPEGLKIVATFTPSYWALHGLQRVIYFNKSYEVLMLECPVLLAYATAALLVALPLLRRRHGSAG